MDSSNYQILEDLADPVAKYLVPAIEKAVEVCVRSYLDDEFNDKWIFGTHFWKNTWNRFETLAGFEDCPFNVFGKGNEYKLRIGPFVLRHHRIDRDTQIPKGARAVKSAAYYIQLNLFDEGWDPTVEKDNLVIAIDADVQDGLREVFIGELMPLSPESNQFQWVKKIPVYLAEGAEASTEETVQIKDRRDYSHLTPEEEIPEVTVGLDESKTEIQEEKKVANESE